MLTLAACFCALALPQATLHADGSVSCVSPDMRSQIVPASGAFSEGWRELRVWRQFNGSGAAYPGTALSHALGTPLPPRPPPLCSPPPTRARVCTTAQGR